GEALGGPGGLESPAKQPQIRRGLCPPPLEIPTPAHAGTSSAVKLRLTGSSAHSASLQRGIIPSPLYPATAPQHSTTQAKVSGTVSEEGPGRPRDNLVAISSPGG
ncbi:hypothetical protein P7K49_029745, partial [Saguinus oedipus]